MSTRKQSTESVQFQPFEDLKKIMESKGLRITCKAPVPVKAVPIKDESPNDEELFFKAMKDVREIQEFRRIPVSRRKEVKVRRSNSSDMESVKALEELVSGLMAMHLPHTQEYVEWVNQDYRGISIQDLHEGKFSVQDYLDLHGMGVDEAESAVGCFFKESLRKSYRCIKIIHGRGLRSPNGPVLKCALIKWLSGRYRKYIVAFASARQCDGGLGAVYILLR